MSDELPEGWGVVSLLEISELIRELLREGRGGEGARKGLIPSFGRTNIQKDWYSATFSMYRKSESDTSKC